MAITRQTMSNEQRKSVVLEYFKSMDNGGVTADGQSMFTLFDERAQACFPKGGLANGRADIEKMFGEVGSTLKGITHHYASFNWVFSGGDIVVVEGTSHGEHRDGTWRAGTPEWAAGRFCDVFEIHDFLIQRVFIYLDPDYAAQDVGRYPWLSGR